MTVRAAPTAPAEQPEAEAKPAPSGRLLLRMPRTLHAELARRAEQDGTSLNQFITSALASAIGWGSPNAEAAGTPASHGSNRALLLVLVANAVAIGLAALAATAILLLAWLG